MTAPGAARPKPVILVVDDEEVIRNLFHRYIGMLGYTPMTVATGADALNSVKQTRPDIILLDIAMPGMDGIQTLRELHSLGCTSAVIMVTAVNDMQIAQQALSFGARDYLMKPVDLPTLKKTLEMHLAHP